MARPRTNEITRHKIDDPGIISFSRRDVEAEIPTKIKTGGIAYAGSEFEGKRVIMLVLRD